MNPDPVALLARYHAALEPYDAGKVAAMFESGAVYVSPGVNGRLQGRAAILEAFGAYFAEHPDQRAVDERIDLLSPLCARSLWRLEATARSTGATVSRRGTETVTFNAAGLIVHIVVEDR